MENSFRALASVFAASGTALASLVRVELKSTMSAHGALRCGEFASHSLVVRDAVIRVDPLGPFLVSSEALKECLVAFPEPPVCSRLPCHSGSKRRSQTKASSRFAEGVSHLWVVMVMPRGLYRLLRLLLLLGPSPFEDLGVVVPAT